MHKALVPLLKIQNLDLQIMQLMRLKRARIAELDNLKTIKSDLDKQVSIKETEIREMKQAIGLIEVEITETKAKLKRLEGQQSLVKKVDEFNALSQEIAHAERERNAKEHRLSDMYDKLAAEEEILSNLKNTLQSTSDSSRQLEQEICDRVVKINSEGIILQKEREELVNDADPAILQIYERLLRNKKDRVIVPIENRCCSGCHIQITAQDENLVRKGERLIYCEHCSRIHYWQESTAVDGPTATRKRRRRPAARV